MKISNIINENAPDAQTAMGAKIAGDKLGAKGSGQRIAMAMDKVVAGQALPSQLAQEIAPFVGQLEKILANPSLRQKFLMLAQQADKLDESAEGRLAIGSKIESVKGGQVTGEVLGFKTQGGVDKVVFRNDADGKRYATAVENVRVVATESAPKFDDTFYLVLNVYNMIHNPDEWMHSDKSDLFPGEADAIYDFHEKYGEYGDRWFKAAKRAGKPHDDNDYDQFVKQYVAKVAKISLPEVEKILSSVSSLNEGVEEMLAKYHKYKDKQMSPVEAQEFRKMVRKLKAAGVDLSEGERHGNDKIYDKCWKGYRKVPGKKRGEPGSCEKIKK